MRAETIPALVKNAGPGLGTPTRQLHVRVITTDRLGIERVVFHVDLHVRHGADAGLKAGQLQRHDGRSSGPFAARKLISGRSEYLKYARIKWKRHDPAQSHRIMLSTTTQRGRASIRSPLEKSASETATAPSACSLPMSKTTPLQELRRETQNVIGLGKCFPDFFRGSKRHGGVAVGNLRSC
jgi:hypothetical protein